MKYINLAFRSAQRSKKIIAKIRSEITKPWVLMEMCGGQTHAILRYGLDQILPKEVEIVHGPGCPVCVTATETIDKAILLAQRSDLILTSYGDMLRVPGSSTDLFSARANGADVRFVYSALDAIQIAKNNPAKEVVFFGIGFETTAPANAAAILAAKNSGLKNFSLLVSQYCVPPAIELILKSPENRVQGFLAAGHVCAVMGTAEYEQLTARYSVPICVTGFEPLDLLIGIYETIHMLENAQATLINGYTRTVNTEGNAATKKILIDLFEPCDRQWRGIGLIPASGWKLCESYAQFDAEKKFSIESLHAHEPIQCHSGRILQGLEKPTDCPAFGTTCTPQNPFGAPMVSAEGACNAYYRYRRTQS